MCNFLIKMCLIIDTFNTTYSLSKLCSFLFLVVVWSLLLEHRLNSVALIERAASCSLKMLFFIYKKEPGR